MKQIIAAVPTIKLDSMAFVTDGQHGYHEVDDSSEIRHLTAKSVREGVVTDAGADRLAASTHAANPESQLEVDDILLSTAGTIGNAGIVTAHVLPANIDQDVARIKTNPKSRVHPYFLAAFLRSEYGQFQCQRATTGQIQGHINLTALRNFDVPVMARQREVVALVRSGLASYWDGVHSLEQAESALAKSVGLESPGGVSQDSYSRSIKEMLNAQRFDGEYFHPRHQTVLSKMAISALAIKDVADLVQEPFMVSTVKKDAFRYIEIGSLTGDGRACSEETSVAEAPSRARWIVRAGDVITSTVRPIRRLSAIVDDEQDGCICSSGFAVLRPKEGQIEPEVLLTYLRLPSVCDILNLYATASMYPAIPVNRLMEIPFASPKASTRSKVVACVRRAFASKRESAERLNQAMRLVEAMIGEK